MSRGLTAVFLFCFASIGRADASLPSRIGSFRKIAVSNSAPPDPAVFKEFGFVSSESAEYRGPQGKGSLTICRMQDATDALAAWDWLRPRDSKHCAVADHCAEQGSQILLLDANYVLDFQGFAPRKQDFQALVAGLPDRHPSDVPPVVNFVPLKDLVPNSARYILGPLSLKAVAPELSEANPGFDQGAEAHYTAYRVDGGVVRLVLFDYPSPGIARQHTVAFKLVPGAQVKRSTMLVAVILPGASETQGNAVLDQVKYQAKILWNEPPPPNPIPTLYRLLINIIILSVILSALALAAGIVYGLLRLYRRRYGTLEEDEAMTTLHLTGER
jgi:hypothetical protein